MFDQMSEDDSRCYAYNLSGQRCEMIAGHDGSHNVVIAWGPDECWTPANALVPPTLVYIGKDEITSSPDVEHLVDIPKPSGKCVICSHRMHTGMCSDKDGEFDCDCANGVEE